MKILGVIPARYNSTRFPGKPLADILGKPMVWWVYEQAKRARNLDELVVATDDERIVRVCDSFKIPTVMTKEHINCFHRVHEVSGRIKADRYLLVNGDEPIIESEVLEDVINEAIKTKPYFLFTYRKFKEAVEVLDTSNIKVVISEKNKLLYLSRIPLPYPHKSLNFHYTKIVGIQVFSKEALDFFVKTPPSKLEMIEDIAELRWIENHKIVDCKELISNSLSVDTPKDLQRVIQIIKEKFDKGELLDIKAKL